MASVACQNDSKPSKQEACQPHGIMIHYVAHRSALKSCTCHARSCEADCIEDMGCYLAVQMCDFDLAPREVHITTSSALLNTAQDTLAKAA